ncbi:ABC transporter permease subunit [Nonomuraea soli]|uniref:DUF1349 domain-containing protein n=1 Tax=Nonomuraea soli TaxID=1032476 RepID=A0A7W0CMQ1_9ACTN|nr:ABC transporter permease subunit [Nonomuraea soli]MBA2894012.1 hypothetical protein [Nonomuraea soli]
MTTTTRPRSQARAARDGFAQLLRAEWTKFRTVRGWTIGLVVALLVIPAFGLLFAANSFSSCMQGTKEVACPVPPTGPGGEAVNDKFFFVHQPLTGDGTITARVASLSGTITYPPPNHDKIVPGNTPWAKAGLMIKEGLEQGSSYAAVMVTAKHGVRMQHDFTEDAAGSASAPGGRWLKLSRSGDTITGSESADGRTWSTVSTVRMDDLPDTVQIGLFVASPDDMTLTGNSLGGSISTSRLANATATFDNVTPSATGEWTRTDVGVTLGPDGHTPHRPGEATQSGDTFTVTGNGDIAPVTADGVRYSSILTGTLAAMIAVTVVAVMYITAEYRRGMIAITMLASPRRHRAIAAKAVVIGSVTLAGALVATVATIAVSLPILRDNGNFILPISFLTQARIVGGTAALLAVTAVFALGLGVIFRRSAAAIVTTFALIVLPYILATTSLLPTGPAQWLLRLTPAAAFAVQQSMPSYPHVLTSESPLEGYFPLPAWAGFGVLCIYAALALGVAIHRLRSRDV